MPDANNVTKDQLLKEINWIIEEVDGHQWSDDDTDIKNALKELLQRAMNELDRLLRGSQSADSEAQPNSSNQKPLRQKANPVLNGDELLSALKKLKSVFIQEDGSRKELDYSELKAALENVESSLSVRYRLSYLKKIRRKAYLRSTALTLGVLTLIGSLVAITVAVIIPALPAMLLGISVLTLLAISMAFIGLMGALLIASVGFFKAHRKYQNMASSSMPLFKDLPSLSEKIINKLTSSLLFRGESLPQLRESIKNDLEAKVEKVKAELESVKAVIDKFERLCLLSPPLSDPQNQELANSITEWNTLLENDSGSSLTMDSTMPQLANQYRKFLKKTPNNRDIENAGIVYVRIWFGFAARDRSFLFDRTLSLLHLKRDLLDSWLEFHTNTDDYVNSKINKYKVARKTSFSPKPENRFESRMHKSSKDALRWGEVSIAQCRFNLFTPHSDKISKVLCEEFEVVSNAVQLKAGSDY